MSTTEPRAESDPVLDTGSDAARPGGVSRRAVLGALGGGLVLVGAGTTFVLTRDGGGGGTGDAADREGILRIGRTYLDAVPEERDPAMLARSLSGFDPAGPVAGLAGIADAVAADFAAGDTVVVGGFLLARTEARAAALMTLDRG